MAKKRKTTVPMMLFWSKRDQRRFIDAVERMQTLINDLESLLQEPKRRAQVAAATRKAKAAADEAAAAAGAPVEDVPFNESEGKADEI